MVAMCRKDEASFLIQIASLSFMNFKRKLLGPWSLACGLENTFKIPLLDLMH